MAELEFLVPEPVVNLFVGFCEATGLRWGPNPRNLFFYRPPHLHLLEFVLFHLFVYGVYRCVPTYFRDAVRHPAPSGMPQSLLNRCIGALFLACWLFQVVLKGMRPNPLVQLCWLFMPCHLITLLWVYVLLYATPRMRNKRLCVYLASLAAAFHWGPVGAAMFPDWSDHQFKIEGSMFVLHHGLLVLTPVYFAARYGLLPFTWRFLLHATWVATLINVGPYTIISYVSGLNVNYHLYPPPKLMTLWVFASPYYRFYVIAILVVQTVGFYLTVVILGKAVRFATRVTSK